MRTTTNLCLTALLFVSQSLPGAVGNDPLGMFFDGLKTLQADFRQQSIDAAGAVLQQAGGTLWIQRPGRFRWDYQTPYRQLILADGTHLWSYDADLEQATVKEMDEVLTSTPAMLLSGDRPIHEVFMVTHLGEQDGFQWVKLQPKSKETGFERIQLGFAGDTLARMEMRDLLGQTVQFTFTQVQRNGSLPPDLFVFVPPPGVDVIGALPEGR